MEREERGRERKGRETSYAASINLLVFNLRQISDKIIKNKSIGRRERERKRERERERERGRRRERKTSRERERERERGYREVRSEDFGENVFEFLESVLLRER